MSSDKTKLDSGTSERPIYPNDLAYAPRHEGSSKGRDSAPVVLVDMEAGVLVEQSDIDDENILHSTWNQTKFSNTAGKKERTSVFHLLIQRSDGCRFWTKSY